MKRFAITALVIVLTYAIRAATSAVYAWHTLIALAVGLGLGDWDYWQHVQDHHAEGKRLR